MKHAPDTKVRVTIARVSFPFTTNLVALVFTGSLSGIIGEPIVPNEFFTISNGHRRFELDEIIFVYMHPLGGHGKICNACMMW